IQVSFSVEVSISEMLPNALSAREGIYEETSEVAGKNDPVPLLVQTPPPACNTVPLIATWAESAQMVISAPANTIGLGKMVNSTESTTGLHFPFPVVVAIKYIVFAAVSSLLT